MRETKSVAYLPLLLQPSDCPFPARAFLERVDCNVSAIIDSKGRGLRIVKGGSWKDRIVRPGNLRLIHDRSFDNVFNQLTRSTPRS